MKVSPPLIHMIDFIGICLLGRRRRTFFPALAAHGRTVFTAAAVAVLCAIGVTPRANAAVKYWDPNGSSNDIGGKGTWDTTTSIWTTNSNGGGGPYSAWSANTDDAHFIGDPGYITLGSAITVKSVTFDNSLFFLASGNTLTMSGGSIDTGANSDTIATVIGGSSGLTKIGTGTLTLGATNTFTNGVNINGGTLSISADAQLGNSANGVTFGGAGATLGVAASLSNSRTYTLGTGNTFDVAGGQTLTLGGSVTGSGGLVVQDGGTLQMNGTNNFTGATTVNSGAKLALGFATTNAQKIDPTQALILGGGTLSITGNASAVSSQAVNGLTLNAGAGGLSVTAGNNHAASLSLGAINSRSAGSTFNLTLTNSGTGTASVGTTAGNDTYGILGGYATITSASGADWATVNGSNNIVAFTAYTTQNNVSSWGNNQNIAPMTSGAFSGSLAHDLTIDSLKFAGTNSANSVNLGGHTLTIGSGGVLLTGSAGGTISNGTLTTGNATDLIINHNSSTPLTISSTIADPDGSTPIALTKSGTGTLALSGANTYSNGTYLNAGALMLQSSSNATGPLTSGPLGTGTLTATGQESLSVNGQTLRNGIALAAGGKLTITTGGVLSGNISGAGSLVINTTASNYLTLTGDNTYSGGTTTNSVAPPTLIVLVGSDTAFGSGPVTWNSGTLIPVNGPRTISTPVTFSSPVAINGANDLTFAGPLFEAASINSLLFNNTGTVTIAGGLAANNTTINFSGLGVVKATSLLSSGGASPNITISGNTLQLAGANGGIINTTAIIANGSLVLDDTGVAANNNPDRMSSGVTISGGVFSLLGNASAASSESLGALTVGQSGTSNGGTATVLVQNGGPGATLTFASLSQTGSSRATVNFTAGSGTLSTTSANHARIAVTSAPTLTNNVLGDSATAHVPGWATVNGSDWASYDASTQSIIPLGTYSAFASAALTANALLSSSGDTKAQASTYSVNTLKMSAATGGSYTLMINGTGDLSAGGYLLTGNADFTIAGSSTGKIAVAMNANRYFYVDTDRTLTISALFESAAGASVIMSGPGTLSLTGTGTSNSSATDNLTINGGEVRVNNANSFGSLLGGSGAELQLRGGVLETDVTGGSVTFTKNVLTTAVTGSAGTMNWGNGGGGFAAYSSGGDTNALTVTLTPAVSGGFAAAGSTLTWGSTFGFVPTGSPLIFGSATANRQVNFTNPIEFGDAVREIQVNGNTVAQLNGALSSTAANIQSGLAKTGPGTLVLHSVNTYAGDTTVYAGTLQLAAGDNTLWHTTNNGGDVYGELIADGGTVDLMGSNQQAGIVIVQNNGTIASTGNVANALTGSAYDMRSGTVSAALAGAGVALTKTTSDTITLRGVNTYSGPTTISAGTLALSTTGNNNIASSPTITVAAGAFLDITGVTGAGGFKLASNQTLNGTGTIVGNLTFGAGSMLSPGNSPGVIFETGDQTWAAGGTYEWQINNWTGAEGTNTDFLNITGGLNITAASGAFPGNQFRIDIAGLTAGNDAGAVPGFDRTSNQSWTIATASAGITGFDVNHFFLDTTDFAAANNMTGGAFNLSIVNESGGGQGLVLSYTAAALPEPASAAFLVCAGIAMLHRRRR